MKIINICLSIAVCLFVSLLFGFTFTGWLLGVIISYLLHDFAFPFRLKLFRKRKHQYTEDNYSANKQGSTHAQITDLNQSDLEREIALIPKPKDTIEFYLNFVVYLNRKFFEKGLTNYQVSRTISNDYEELLSIVYNEQQDYFTDKARNILEVFEKILRMEDNLANEKFSQLFRSHNVKKTVIEIIRDSYKHTDEFKIYAKQHRIRVD